MPDGPMLHVGWEEGPGIILQLTGDGIVLELILSWWFFLYHPTHVLCFTTFEWSKASLASILYLLWPYFSHGMQATHLPPGSQWNTIIVIGLCIVPNSTMWQNWLTRGIKIWACSFGHCEEYLVCRWGRCTQGVVQDTKDKIFELGLFESSDQLWTSLILHWKYHMTT